MAQQGDGRGVLHDEMQLDKNIVMNQSPFFTAMVQVHLLVWDVSVFLQRQLVVMSKERHTIVFPHMILIYGARYSISYMLSDRNHKPSALPP